MDPTRINPDDLPDPNPDTVGVFDDFDDDFDDSAEADAWMAEVKAAVDAGMGDV